MNMVTASQIIFGAASGLIVGVNAVAVKPTGNDGVTHEYGPRVRAAATVSLSLVAAALTSDSISIGEQSPEEFMDGPITGTPPSLSIGSGEVRVFSDSNGWSAISGYFDLKYTLELNLKQKEQ
jgi:hypothetical protein